MDTPQKPKQTRRRAPKVRSGCLNCKIRRVKCDETKPTCLRCLARGCSCVWSAPLKRPVTAATLAAKPSSDLYIETVGHWPKLSLPPLHQPQKILFANDSEHHYFRLFCTNTSKKLSGCFSSDLWSHLILQASETEPSVRYAATAIGALDMTSGAIQAIRVNFGLESALEHHNPILTAKDHHSFALQQYGKALKFMSTAEITGKQSLRTRLICIILTICFEIYHGNYENATLQTKVGMQMILDWMVQSTTCAPSFAVQGSIAPQESIDTELRDVFGRLDATTVTKLDSQYLRHREIVRENELQFLEGMPLRFSSVQEARCHLDLIIRRLMPRQTPDSAENDETGLTTLFTFKDSVKHRVVNAGAISIQVVNSEAAQVQSFLTKWKTAFESGEFLPRAKVSVISKDYLAAVALKLLYLNTLVRLAVGVAKAQVDIDDYRAEFEEMVSLGSILIKNSDALSGNFRFTFDSVYVVPLYIAARACRHPLIRRNAISLLLTSPRKEGNWDSAMAGKLADWVMSIEEEDMVNGFIPEHARTYGLEVIFDLKTITVRVRCWQRTPNGTAVKRESDLVWDEWT